MSGIDIQYGFNSTLSNTINSLNVLQTLTENPGVSSCRVEDIVLDNSNKELFDKVGGWNGIGAIFYAPISTDANARYTGELKVAFPLFPNIKHYPLKNEIVPILQLADAGIDANTFAVQSYYLPPINIWSSQVNNAMPGPEPPIPLISPFDPNDYTAVEAGSSIGTVRQISDGSTDVNLGVTFNDNNTIKNQPLLPYEGDIIYEGRFGNSIRLGATVKNANLANTWSTEGTNGDPITIIRNGQGTKGVIDNTTDPWVSTVENINEDNSSIYMTSTQKIPLDISSTKKDSFKGETSPKDANVYNQSQILLNSGRLVFNSKVDSILMFSRDTIHLSADNSVNIDAGRQFVLDAGRVYLGSNQNAEPAVMGKALMDNLETIASVLELIGNALVTHTTILGPAPTLTVSGQPLTSAMVSLKAAISSKIMLSDKVNISK
jgi:hypothetical protein